MRDYKVIYALIDLDGVFFWREREVRTSTEWLAVALALDKEDLAPFKTVDIKDVREC